MKWRDSAGLTVAVLILLVLGAQPAARWIVTRTISQYTPGTATMTGNASWDPVRHRWTCSELHVDGVGGESLHAAQATIRLDANELIRRNLVIDSVRVDGMVIQAPRRQQDLDACDWRTGSTLAAFSPETWADTLLNEHKRSVLSASQRREHRRTELRQQLEQLHQRCAELEAAASSNPLRSKIDFQEVRREVVKILQSLAEERIRVRESDRDLATSIERFQATWRDDLAQSIRNQLPDQPRLVQLIAQKSLAQYWELREQLISYASLAAKPLKEENRSAYGREVWIPGVPNNYLMIRSAHLVGTIAIEDQPPVRFRAAITGWGDTTCTADTKSDWQFEWAGGDTTSVIRAHTERAKYADADAIVTWAEHADPALLCRGRWQTTTNGLRCDLTIPVDSLAELSRSSSLTALEGKIDWESCWNQTIDDYRGRYLHASLPARSIGSTGELDRRSSSDTEVSEESIALISEIWNRTLAAYISRASDRVETRIPGLRTAMEMVRTQCWSNGMQQYLEDLASLEREAQLVKDNWDDYGSFHERLARMRRDKTGY